MKGEINLKEGVWLSGKECPVYNAVAGNSMGEGRKEGRKEGRNVGVREVIINKERAQKFDTAYGLGESRFYQVIKSLITERSKHPTGSLNNLLYKFMANAGIGAMGRGLNQKTVYDPSTGGYSTVPAGVLTNPLYAG